MLSRSLFVVGVLASAGCVAEVGELCGGPLHVITEPVVVPRPADVVFVVDNSRSMAEEQELLARSFGRFIDEVAGSGEYRIAVVSTDMSFGIDDEGEVAGYSEFIHDERHPHGIVGLDDLQCAPLRPRLEHGCFRGRWVDSTTGGRQAQIDRFAANVRVGTCGSGTEEAFSALLQALDNGDTCNRGFRRDDANLVIVFVSDEDDNGFMPIEQFADELERRVDLARVRIASVIGVLDGAPSHCSPERGAVCGGYCFEVNAFGSHAPCSWDASGTCPVGEVCIPLGANAAPRCVYDTPDATHCASCSRFRIEDCCSAEPGRRYVNFAKEIERRAAELNPSLVPNGCAGGGQSACVTETICATDFGDSLARIARELVASTEYTLDPPVESARRLEVHLVGPRFAGGEQKLELGSGYRLSEDGGTVSLLVAPNTDDTVRIRYRNSIEIPGVNCLPN